MDDTIKAIRVMAQQGELNREEMLKIEALLKTEKNEERRYLLQILQMQHQSQRTLTGLLMSFTALEQKINKQ
jgi:hypothetical protein